VAITADSVEAKPASSEAPKETPAARREVKPVFKRVERAVFSDVYNLLLALPLGWMIVLVAGLFLACNLVFAGLFSNRRTNAILDVKVMINIARQVRTKEGQSLRRFEELNPVKASAPLFAYTWTIVCPIDEASPLYGLSADDLADQHAEIIVVLGGVDDRFNQSVYARCSYTPDEIFFGRRFADVLSVRPDGRWVVDYGRFHDTVQT
jgi:hypothetical protein